MAQTTTAISWVDSQVYYGFDTATFIDASGVSNMIELSGGDRGIGENFTSDGDVPIITAGKRGAIRVTWTFVYTPGATDAFTELLGKYDSDGGGLLSLRWEPAGSDSGNLQYTAEQGEIESFQYPQGSADSPDALQGMVTVAYQLIVGPTTI